MKMILRGKDTNIAALKIKTGQSNIKEEIIPYPTVNEV